MKNISYNNFIICLGDDVRYRFAQELMPSGHIIDSNTLKINKSYIFVHSEEENVIADDKKVLVFSKKMAEGRILEFPVSSVDVKTILTDQKVRIGKILIFADFPYKKENLHYLVEKICKKSENADVDVVLYNERRRTGYTDIERSEKILTEALKDFGVFNIDIYGYFGVSDISEIFTVRPNNLRCIKNKYLKELKASQYRLDNRFDIHYKTFLERTYDHYFSLNNPDEFAKYIKIFSHSNMPDGITDIWAVYIQDFKNIYLYSSSDIMNEIAEFYLDYISEILGYRLKDEEIFIKKLAIVLFEKCFDGHPVIASAGSALEYKEILNRNNVITEFSNKIEKFFYDDLKNMLHEFAAKKLNSIRAEITKQE